MRKIWQNFSKKSFRYVYLNNIITIILYSIMNFHTPIVYRLTVHQLVQYLKIIHSSETAQLLEMSSINWLRDPLYGSYLCELCHHFSTNLTITVGSRDQKLQGQIWSPLGTHHISGGQSLDWCINLRRCLHETWNEFMPTYNSH